MHKCPCEPVKVYLWKSSSIVDLYIFDTSGKQHQDNHTLINQNIYQDDTIETALSKIGLNIKKNEKFKIYAWVKKQPIVFKIKKAC